MNKLHVIVISGAMLSMLKIDVMLDRDISIYFFLDSLYSYLIGVASSENLLNLAIHWVGRYVNN